MFLIAAASKTHRNHSNSYLRASYPLLQQIQRLTTRYPNTNSANLFTSESMQPTTFRRLDSSGDSTRCHPHRQAENGVCSFVKTSFCWEFGHKWHECSLKSQHKFKKEIREIYLVDKTHIDFVSNFTLYFFFGQNCGPVVFSWKTSLWLESTKAFGLFVTAVLGGKNLSVVFVNFGPQWRGVVVLIFFVHRCPWRFKQSFGECGLKPNNLLSPRVCHRICSNEEEVKEGKARMRWHCNDQINCAPT